MVEGTARCEAGRVRNVRDLQTEPADELAPAVVPCRFCGRAATLRLRTRDWNRRLSEVTFHYYRCSGCDLTFLSPVPTDLGRYYPADYYPMPASLTDLARIA